MTTVYIRNSDYQEKTLKNTVYELLSLVGDDSIQAGTKVLIKPNFLIPAGPERGVITHPLLVKSVAQYCLERDALVQISDSPAFGTISRVIRVGGHEKALSGMNVKFQEFYTVKEVHIEKPFGKIQIAEDVLDADMVINLPKLKTHAQMLLTLGVKNLFGCIVGAEKPEWHLRSGVDRDMFSNLLVQIYQVVRPSITIVDGILALEGQGPGKSGKPRRLNLLVAGQDAHAVDQVICTFLGKNPEDYPIWKAARRMGVLDEPVEIDGPIPKITDFEFPRLGKLVGGPKFIQKLMRNHLLQRPAVSDKICKSCMACRDTCPANAITSHETGLSFDYDHCIRCYCCLEICPEGAIRAVEPLAGKVCRKLREIKNRNRLSS
jgi:uncharacterized protein (DUF362 family)/Pyruvate/2-oxoacid:ferredoxin oxidoreductase delta subunit